MLREKVISFLNAMGVTVSDNDSLLDFVIQSVTQTVKNETNQLAFPEGLEMSAVYICAGQYLKIKKEAGLLEGFDFEATVKQIQEGDTSITFAIGEGDNTPEQRFDSLISYLMSSGKSGIAKYRRLVW